MATQNAVQDLKDDAEAIACGQKMLDLIVPMLRAGDIAPVTAARAITLVCYQLVHMSAKPGHERDLLGLAAKYLQKDPADVLIEG